MIAKLLGLFLLATAGIAQANDAFTVTVVPVKQYGLAGGATYSGWYYKYHDKLGPEHNGPMYTSEPYKNHFNLWLRVEDMTPEQVNKNPNNILTVPVSGQLAQEASYYRILSTVNELRELVIGDTKYTKSDEKGAEKLYRAEKVGAILPASEPVAPTVIKHEPLPIMPPAQSIAVHEPAPVVQTAKSLPAKEFSLAWILLGLSVLSIGYLSWVVNKKGALLTSVQKELADLKALFARLIASFKVEDKDLVTVIESANILAIQDGIVYLPKINRGAEVLVGDTLSANDPRNVGSAIRRCHAQYLAG
jgi:hypothetical protein